MNIPPAVVMGLLAGILVGAAMVYGWFSVRLSKGQPLLPREWQRPVPWDGVDVALIIAVFVLLQLTCFNIAIRALGIDTPIDRTHPNPQLDFALVASNLAASSGTLLLAVAILRLRAGATAREMGLDWELLPGDAQTGFIAFLAVAPVVYGVQIILVEVLKIEYDHPLIDSIKERPDGLMIFVATLSAVFAAPIVEEFLFRVVLQGWLEKLELRLASEPSAVGSIAEPITPSASIGDGKLPEPVSSAPTRGLFGLPLGALPILVSSILFASMHFGQGAAPIPLFLLALVLGYLYQRTHRLVPSVTVHMLLNGLSMIMFFSEPTAGAAH